MNSKYMLFLLPLIVINLVAGDAQKVKIHDRAKAFIEKYCLDCHDKDTQKFRHLADHPPGCRLPIEPICSQPGNGQRAVSVTFHLEAVPNSLAARHSKAYAGIVAGRSLSLIHI